MGCIYVYNATTQTPQYIELNNYGMESNCSGEPSSRETLGAANPANTFVPALVAIVERIPGPNLANSPIFYDENDLTIIWGSGVDADVYQGTITFDHDDRRDYVMYIFDKSVALMVASSDTPNEARQILADG